MSSVSIVQKVVAPDGSPEAWFGSAVALSGDLAVFGAPNAQVGANAGQGAVYVFRRIKDVWTEVQKIVAGDGGVSEQFGQTIALLAPKVLAVAAPFARINGVTWVGAVYVYEFDGKSWLQRQKLTPADEVPFGTFGRSVAITQTDLLVGAGGASMSSGHVRGSVYVFRFASSSASGVWSQVQKISAPDPDDDTAFFGSPIAISASSAVVGSYAATVNGNLGQGAAYAYKFLNGSWVQTAKLVASDGATRANFGHSVTLQGKTAFIGAPGASVHGNVSQGSVYRFENRVRDGRRCSSW